MVTVRNAADAWVNQQSPATNYNGKQKMWLRTAASQNMFGWIFFTKPWPAGVTITRGELVVYTAEALGTSTTLTVQLASAKWGVNTIRYNLQPGLTGSTATAVKATAVAGERWVIDIKTLLQAATTAPWYGIRISTSRSVAHSIYATESSSATMRPHMIVEWAETPEAPTFQNPSGGLVAFEQKPHTTWDYNDPGGETALAAIQVQTASSEANLLAGTTTFDSGQIAPTPTTPDLDLATTAYAGVAAGVTTWWRARNKEGAAGLWSAWGDPASFTWQPRGTLTIVDPAASPNNFIYRAGLLVSWTFTGQTQRHYQVYLALASNPSVWLWDSGKITGTATSINIPDGYATDANATYTIGVRVWDSLNRVATPGEPLYTEATRNATFNYDGVVDTHITGLGVTPDPLWPVAVLTWTRSGAVLPIAFVIQRSLDGGTTWTNVDEVTEPEALVSGSNYTYVDKTAPGYKTVTWRVQPVNATNSRMTSGNPTTSGIIRRLAPFLYSTAADAVCFLNPKRSRKNLDVQGMHEPIGGPPALVTQRLGGRAGTVEGRFVSDVIPGVTAEDMYKRFRDLRTRTGQTMYVALANETIRCVAYNFQDEVLTDASGITYECSFDWIEV